MNIDTLFGNDSWGNTNYFSPKPFGWVVIILTMLCIVTGSILGSSVPQTVGGQHTGIVTAVENNFIWGTYTVYFKTSSTSSQEDSYCANNDSNLVGQLQTLVQNQHEATIIYSDQWNISPFRCTKNVITGVK